MIVFVLLTTLLIVYGVRKNLSLRFFTAVGLLFLLSAAAAAVWYMPVTLPLSDSEPVRVRLEIHEEEIRLSDSQSGQLTDLLKEAKLYRGGMKPVLFADHTTSIQFFGKGLDWDYNPASFYILDDRPQLSFAEINGREYRIKDIEVIRVFLQTELEKNKSVSKF